MRGHVRVFSLYQSAEVLSVHLANIGGAGNGTYLLALPRYAADFEPA